MTLGDLLFIVLFLSAMATLVTAGVAVARGKRPRAATLVTRLAGATLVYLAVVYVVALVSPARRLALDEDICSDDWCLAVVSARQTAVDGVPWMEVAFRVSSHAGRISQRELGVLVYLRDDRGRRIDARADSGEPPFDVTLSPLQTVLTRRRFPLEPGIAPRALVVTREGLPFPGCVILGEASGLIHPPELRF